MPGSAAAIVSRLTAMQEFPCGGTIGQHEAAQDKYLELAPEPLHIDEWWVDPRTRAALEASVGLGEHVTFTADQTRPLQLTRSQVRGVGRSWPGGWMPVPVAAT